MILTRTGDMPVREERGEECAIRVIWWRPRD